MDLLMQQASAPLIFAMARGSDAAETLREKMLDLNERAQVIQAFADDDGRSLTLNESRDLNQIFAEFDDCERRLKVADQSEKLARSRGRLASPNQPGACASTGQDDVRPGSRIIHPADKNAGLPRGFNHYGEFFQAVKASGKKGGTIDPRLVMNAPTTYSSEGIGQDGGFAVPAAWSQSVMQILAGEGSLLDLCNRVDVAGNSYVQIKDDLPPWDTSRGIQAYWGSEGGEITQSKIALQDQTSRLHKLTALVPVTEELLEDAPSLDAYLRRKVPSIFDFKIKLAMIRGSGAGEPLGILKSSSLVSVTKETGQDADTILWDNVSRMWGRLLPGSEQRAIWLVSKSCEPQLDQMSVPVGLGGTAIFISNNSGAAEPPSRIKGRPIHWTEACSTLGDQGDIILADLSLYQVIMKTIGLKTDVSMHLWFDYDVLAYRFVMRIDGLPLLTAPITGRDGVTTYSPFICLDERAA